MVKKIAIGLLVVVAVFLGFAAMQPDTYRIQRSLTINAPPEQIFPLINDFRKWVAWSPYEKLDPQLKRTYGGAESGKGAQYAWEGNDQVGIGSMEILESNEPSKVLIKLDFIKPFEGHSNAEFSLVPQANGTNVTWAMFGPKTYMCKVMQLFCDPDSMCGKDFEAGLSNLKAAAEKPASTATVSSPN